jgi:hypothetical protein
MKERGRRRPPVHTVGALSKAIRILLGLLSLGLFVAGVIAFADLQSNERVTLAAVRQACAEAGAPTGPVQVEIAGADASPSMVSDAAAAGLTLLPLSQEAEGARVRLIVGAVNSTGMFSSSVDIRRLGEGTNPGQQIEYQLAWRFGWSVTGTGGG